MKETIRVYNKEDAKKAIISVGQELIRRASDICNDIERVSEITIFSTITVDEVVSLDVSKKYTTVFEEKEGEKDDNSITK